MRDKKQLRKILKNTLNLRFNIRSINPSPEQVQKALFVDSLKTLNEIQDRSQFLSQEMGIDTVGYEDRYFRVIENLFKLHFNAEQLSLIQLYLYELKPDKQWDGTLELQLKEKGPKIVNFKEPADVWQVLTFFK